MTVTQKARQAILGARGEVVSVVHVKDGTTTVERAQDIEPVLAENRLMRNEGVRKHHGKSAEMYARVPNVLLEKWMREDGVNALAMRKGEFSKWIKRKLATAEGSACRVSDRAI